MSEQITSAGVSGQQAKTHRRGGKWNSDWRVNFWANVEKTDSCWLWRGTRNPQGYGTWMINATVSDTGKRKHVRAHRVSYSLVKGAIPEGMFVCHRCDNPSCVNPDHLFLGTPKDNVQDACRKGRMASCERHPRAKLTMAKAREIRQRWASGQGMRSLAREYGVWHGRIVDIVKNRTWIEQEASCAD